MSKKYTQEYVDYIFEINGCECLGNYIDANTNIKYKCICGTISATTFSHFSKGHRCKQCRIQSVKDKKTIKKEQVIDILSKEGYELLSEYKKIKDKITIKCNNGHIYETSFNNFKNGKKRCRQCWVNYYQGDKVYNYNPDRNKRKLSKLLSFKLYNIDLLQDDINYNKYLKNKKDYNIDHVFPRVAFIDNELHLKYDMRTLRNICNSRDNLQIIPKIDNLKKSGKYNNSDFLTWFKEYTRNN